MASNFASFRWFEVKTNTKKILIDINQECVDFLNTKPEVANTISIFGPARSGKSTFMNMLAGIEDPTKEIFLSSDSFQPFTKGVDLSKTFFPLEQFSILNGNSEVVSDREKVTVGFIDTEGQGDQGDDYDVVLFSPILVTAKVVIFFWSGGVEKDGILNSLGSMTQSAKRIVDDSPSQKSQKPFSHLHIVFRTFTYSGTPESVKDFLMKEEDGEKAQIRNQIRKLLVESFESIDVWLFPDGIKPESKEKKKLLYNDFNEKWQAQFKSFRSSISGQMNIPKFINGNALTGKLIGGLSVSLAGVLNNSEPYSIGTVFERTLQAQAEQEGREVIKNIEKAVNDKLNDHTPMTSTGMRDFVNTLKQLLTNYVTSVSSIPKSITNPIKELISSKIDDKVKIIEQDNLRTVEKMEKQEKANAISGIKSEINDTLKKKLPLKNDKLNQEINTIADKYREAYKTKIDPYKDLLSNTSDPLVDILESLQKDVNETNKILWNSNASDLIIQIGENFMTALKDALPEDKMPIDTLEFNAKTSELSNKFKNEFNQNIREYPSELIDGLKEKFGQKIKDYIGTWKDTNETNAALNEKKYTIICDGLIADYYVRLYGSLHGEPNPISDIIKEHKEYIMVQYNQKTSLLPESITRNKQAIFEKNLTDEDIKFRDAYDKYFDKYIATLKDDVDKIYNEIWNAYDQQINNELKNIPMSTIQLNAVFSAARSIAQNDFQTKTSIFLGTRSRNYIDQKKNLLAQTIQNQENSTNNINNDTSQEFCENKWESNVSDIRDKVKNGTYGVISEFDQDLSSFEIKYRNDARGPKSDEVWNSRKNIIDSWRENIRRTIMAIPYNDKNIEDIYYNIMKSALPFVLPFASELGWAWIRWNPENYVLENNSHKWVPTTGFDGYWSDNPVKFEFVNFKTGFKNDFESSEPIIESIQPTTIDTQIFASGDKDEIVDFTVKYSESKQVSWKQSTKFNFSQELSTSFETGVKDMWKATVGAKLGFSQETFNENGTITTATKEQTTTFKVPVPAKKRVEVTAIVYDQSVTVNFIATLSVSVDLTAHGFLRWGGSDVIGADANFHEQYRGDRSPHWWDYEYGDITKIYDQMIQKRKPWLWDECIKYHPDLPSYLAALKNSKRYEFVVAGKFEGIKGRRVEYKRRILNSIA